MIGRRDRQPQPHGGGSPSRLRQMRRQSATSGSVAVPVVVEQGAELHPAGSDEDRLMEAAIEAGADDVGELRGRLGGRPTSPAAFRRSSRP